MHLEPVANSFLTELYNSNLTSYIRVVGNNITSSNNGFQLKMALIAFKDSASWNTLGAYSKPSNLFLRYTQVSAGVTHQSKYSDATLQMTFTLHNGRDSSIFVYNDPVNEEKLNTTLKNAWQQYYQQLIAKGHTANEADLLSNAAFNAEYTYLNQRKLGKNPAPPDFVTILDSLFKSSNAFGGSTVEDAMKNWIKDFNDYAKKISRRSLITLYPYGSYDYTYAAFDKAGLGLTYLFSIDNNLTDNPLQLNIQGNLYAASDTTLKNVNLEQKIGSLSLGINKVIATDIKGQSKFEMMLSATIQHNVESNVKQKSPTADLTIKYKILKNLWVPIDLKYDPQKKGDIWIFKYNI